MNFDKLFKYCQELNKSNSVLLSRTATNFYKLLLSKKEEYKFMINYIVVGALCIVIPEIKEMYPDFSFSF